MLTFTLQNARVFGKGGGRFFAHRAPQLKCTTWTTPPARLESAKLIAETAAETAKKMAEDRFDPQKIRQRMKEAEERKAAKTMSYPARMRSNV